MSALAPKLGVLVKRFPKLSETFILSEILGLERMGFNLTIFSLHRPSDAVEQRANADVGAPVVYLDCKPHGAVADVECALRLAAQLHSHGIRHLHAHFVDRPGGIAALAARFADITFSLSAHAKDIYLSDPAVLARRLRQAAFTATCTEYNRTSLAKLAPAARIHRIYHGIDTQQFSGQNSGDARRSGGILAVGRLRAKKGFSTLVQACALLHEHGVHDVCCDIVGYGEQHDQLQGQIESLGLTDRVRLRGKMDHTALIELYRHSAVFAAPCEIAPDGDRDGIPNVLLEAMAMKLPVVSTPVSGIVELIKDGVNGLLVPPQEPAALAQALSRLLASPALRAQLGDRARSCVVEKFGTQNNLPELAALIAPYTSITRRRYSELQRAAQLSHGMGYANV